MAAKKRTVVCVKVNRNGKWDVQLQGQNKPASSHRLKIAAVKRGRRLAKTSAPAKSRYSVRKGRFKPPTSTTSSTEGRRALVCPQLTAPAERLPFRSPLVAPPRS